MKTNTLSPKVIAACVSALIGLPMPLLAQTVVQASGRIEVAFSPNGGAQQEIRMLAYSFTSAAVVQALLLAKQNSEHIAVNWDNPALAKLYLQHFTRNYAQSVAFHAAY